MSKAILSNLFTSVLLCYQLITLKDCISSNFTRRMCWASFYLLEQESISVQHPTCDETVSHSTCDQLRKGMFLEQQCLQTKRLMPHLKPTERANSISRLRQLQSIWMKTDSSQYPSLSPMSQPSSREPRRNSPSC